MKSILVLDPSSDHLAFSICELDGSNFMIKQCGMLWCIGTWSLGRKLSYIYKGLEFLILDNNITYVHTEHFEMPSFRQSGVSVIPTINNNIKMLIWNIKAATGKEITMDEVPAQTWRKWLGSGSVALLDKKGKPVLTKSGRAKKDFKVPCKNKVEQILGKIIPEQILSNTSMKLRDVPSSYDITDVLGISIAYAVEQRCIQIKADPELFINSRTCQSLNALI